MSLAEIVGKRQEWRACFTVSVAHVHRQTTSPAGSERHKVSVEVSFGTNAISCDVRCLVADRKFSTPSAGLGALPKKHRDNEGAKVKPFVQFSVRC
jgi:hypothetical protein